MRPQVARRPPSNSGYDRAVGRLIAGVTALALASCTTYKGSRDVARSGGALIGGTLLIGSIVADKDDDVSAGDAARVMIPLVVLGLGIMVLGLVGMGAHKVAGNDKPDPQVVTEAPPPVVVDPVAEQHATEERRRRAAWDMTQQARIAAHKGDCERVAYLAARVIEVDRPTFDNVFARDPFIVKCAPKPAPAPPPARSIPIPDLNPPIPPQPPPPPPPVEPAAPEATP